MARKSPEYLEKTNVVWEHDIFVSIKIIIIKKKKKRLQLKIIAYRR